MSKYTSFIPPDVPIPGPPDPLKIVGTVVSALVCVSLVTLIAFLIVEFLTDPEGGTPIQARLPQSVDSPPDENDPPPHKSLPSIEEILSQFRVVTPPNHAEIEGRWITAICRWTPPKGSNDDVPPVTPQLFCDNLLIPWTMTFGNDAWFTRFKVEEAGEHLLTILSQDLSVYVNGSIGENLHSAGETWKPLILHDGTDEPTRCGECHIMIEGKNDLVRKSRGLTIGPLRPSEACFVCHQPGAVKERHSILTEPPGDDCAHCHRLHGEQVQSERVKE